ncbi:bacterio-opsin activator domain-containing protein [Halogeometricum luteum]|uniref:Helix-turn-helix domain-containing protein n=1 Tax=Halogeometricum luteum TaxID=2950537 RepID=A0ABU2FZ05_9EURY|nr:bacterio-opsin activator domain-containing protein [Halogeometricum sp. S3BR5-2]MDS0293762.1 helix-turn-helix domain-containing protein [Halogeometricum sp. S3BR5-2]
MSVIAEFTVPSDDFALHHALTAASEMVVEIERVVATMEDKIMPFFWVSGGDQSDFEEAFRDDPSVTDTTLVDEIEGSVLYRAEWTENVESIIYAYTEIGATILQATGRNEEWELQFRFDNHDKVSQFQAYCEENDISFRLNRLYHQEQPMASAQYGLTSKQRETLVTALDTGYYDIPQRSTMADVAEKVGVSQQAVSKRLHNGHKNLITNALTVNHPDDD